MKSNLKVVLFCEKDFKEHFLRELEHMDVRTTMLEEALKDMLRWKSSVDATIVEINNKIES